LYYWYKFNKLLLPAFIKNNIFEIYFCRIGNQRIMELESQVEDLQENQKTVSNEEIIEINQ
jgi:hypothetical protein